jgi:hypothetical protein
MQSKLLRYKIGLGVLLLFILAVSIFTLLQAGNTRKDAETIKAAQSIAGKLNDYTSENQTAPASLQAAHITNVPSTISYTKTSDTSYKFCVTYKTKNSAPRTSTVVPALLTGGSLSASESFDAYDYDATTLYIDNSHPKGQKCQTIKLSSYYDDSSSSSGSTSSGPYEICGRGYNYSQAVLNVKAINLKSDATSSGTVDVDTYPSTTTVKLAPSVEVYDANCKALALADIHVGDFISLYYSPYGSPATTIIKD